MKQAMKARKGLRSAKSTGKGSRKKSRKNLKKEEEGLSFVWEGGGSILVKSVDEKGKVEETELDKELVLQVLVAALCQGLDLKGQETEKK
jgi:hypothetical protein